jgi:GDP-L-fucose synthase
LWAIENYEHSDPLILSSGIEVSIFELVTAIAKHMEFSGEIVLDETKPDGQFRKPSDSETLHKFLPDFTYLSLDEGLKRTIAWFNQNYSSIRT